MPSKCQPHCRFDRQSPEIQRRVEELLGRMTLDEKVGQMVLRYPADERLFSESMIREGRLGAIADIADIKQVNRLQKIAVSESRLGIPLLVANNLIHGFGTVFPIPLALSCTWDPHTVRRSARIASQEAAVSGTNWNFSPMVDLSRDPRWGRVAEGAGEDVLIGQEMARAYVRGFQAADLTGGRKIAACAKHFAAYGATESGKDYNTVDISEKALREVYLPPFMAAIEEGNGSLMAAFHDLNGVPVTANPFLLKTLLREELGFEGPVASDYNAVAELVQHGVAANLKEAARKAALAGIDIDLHSPAYGRHLAELVREGSVPGETVDRAVRRILGLKFMLGLFDDPCADESLPERIVLCEAHRTTALAAAQKSMVLLKNDSDLLPLSPDNGKIALIGPLADDRGAPLGCWADYATTEPVETVREGLLAALPDGCTLTCVRGCEIEGGGTKGFTEAVAAACQADVVVAVLGESPKMSGEARARVHLGLPGHQQALLEAVHATGTPIILVLMNGRPLVLPWAAEHVPAILEAWHGGIKTGQAVADILLGAVNPSAKLAMSFPRGEGQIPVYYSHKSTGRPAEGEGVMQSVWDSAGSGASLPSYENIYKSTYIDQPNSPLYPFGHGLSYTTFAYANLQVETPTVTADQALVVTVHVTNTGGRAGEEIAQLYVRDLVASTTRPVKELKAFQRVFLQPGEAKTLRFDVPVRSLAFCDSDMHRVVEPGAFNLWLGPSSVEGLEAAFRVAD